MSAPMTQFAAWWAETDRRLEAAGLPKLPFPEARTFHDCEIDPAQAVELVAANHAWAAQRQAALNLEKNQ